MGLPKHFPKHVSAVTNCHLAGTRSFLDEGAFCGSLENRLLFKVTEASTSGRSEVLRYGTKELVLPPSFMTPEKRTGKIAPHCHSYYSPLKDGLFDEDNGAREAYLSPEESVMFQIESGMTLLALSDHNQIAGALRARDWLAKYGWADRMAIFCESDTWFPDSGARIHLESAGIDEAIYHEIEYLRRNIWDLIGYLEKLEEQMVRKWPTHLLLDVNGKKLGEEHSLTMQNIRDLLARVNILEVRNGTRPERPNLAVERYAEKFDKSMIGAPDAHSLPKFKTWTEFPFEGPGPVYADFVRALDERQTTPHGECGGTPSLTANIGMCLKDYYHIRQSEESAGKIPVIQVTRHNENGTVDKVNWKHEVVTPEDEKERPSEHALHRVIELVKVMSGGEVDPKLKAKVEKRIRNFIARRMLAHGKSKWREVRDEWKNDGIGAIISRVPTSKNDWTKLREKAEQSAGNLEVGDQEFFAIVEEVLMEIFTSKEDREAILSEPGTEDKIFETCRKVIDKVVVLFIEDFVRQIEMVMADKTIKPHEIEQLFDTITHRILQIVKSQILLLPYHASFNIMGIETRLVQAFSEEYGLDMEEPLLNATDTVLETNGPSRSTREMIRQSIARNIPFITVTALTPEEKQRAMEDPELKKWIEMGKLKIFEPIYERVITPEGTDQEEGNETTRIRLISQMELQEFMEKNGITRVNVQTPGPVGLQTLIAAKLRGLPVSVIHHTDFHKVAAERYGELPGMAALKLTKFIYHWVDTVISVSPVTTEELIGDGCVQPGQKLLELDRWVNTDIFHPRHRSETFWEELGIENAGKKVKFLYTGRIAPEKNLDVAIEAFKQTIDQVGRENAQLIIVGPVQDQNYLAELQALCAGYEDCVSFPGAMHGEKLSQAYASSEGFVFPSESDTFGKSPIEAQASGLFALVTNKGGPQTVVSQEEGSRSGYVIKAGDAKAFAERMTELVLNPELRAELSRNARRYAEMRFAELGGRPYSAVLDPKNLPPRYNKTGKVMAHGHTPDMLTQGLAELSTEEMQKAIGLLQQRIKDATGQISEEAA